MLPCFSHMSPCWVFIEWHQLSGCQDQLVSLLCVLATAHPPCEYCHAVIVVCHFSPDDDKFSALKAEMIPSEFFIVSPEPSTRPAMLVVCPP